ncbi:MAG: MarR family transcriptional regulator [Melioribacteraceae bacterium]|nr:MarR family transcriptional regulator [Melioribacteraceae bacterium]
MNENQKFDSLSKELTFLTCELSRACQNKEKFFASTFNLTLAEFKCLRLFTGRSYLSIKELASEMNITPGRITHILTSLEDKKFILRKIDQTDRRNVIVHLTSKSEPFIKNLNESHVKQHKEILDKIAPENRDLVISAIKDLIKAIKHWSEKS